MTIPAEEKHVVPGSSAGVRLSIMMFLQYAVWGVWLPSLAIYLGAPRDQGGLGFTGSQIGWLLGLAGSIGAVTAPFIAGQVADRIMNAERSLGVLLLLGGGVNIALSQVSTFPAFLLLAIVYSILYMPTLSLTNSISFQNLDDVERKFPFIRSFGTIGWIVASNAIAILWIATTGDPVEKNRRIGDALMVSGIISIAYAVFAFTVLPKTPPRRDAAEPLAVLKAFGLLRNPTFLVLTLVALPISMIHQCYFFRTAPFLNDAVGLSKESVNPVMSIGQVSEIVFLAILGLLLRRLGYQKVLMLGTMAYLVRFAIFAFVTEPAIIIAAQALHGLCYGCFFAGSYLLVEKIAGADIRHSAQTVFGIIILGLGPIFAGFYNGLFDRYKVERIVDGASVVMQDYHQFWRAQAVIALVATLALIALRPAADATRQTPQ